MKKAYLNYLALLPLLFCSCKSKNKEEPITYDEEGRIAIHTKVQRAFFKDSLENVDLYARGKEELSRPLTPTFKWEGENNAYTVYLSENPDYSSPEIYEVSKNEVSFGNLKINTKYYFKAVSGESVVHEESFTTSSEIIRNIYISGVTNARDLGGYKVGDSVTKQGLIYRTGRLNQNKTETVENKITEKGIKTMLEGLKVKSEIDLRLVDNNEVGCLSEPTGVLGESVRYFQCPMHTSTLETEAGYVSLRKVFSILGNRDNYPTFFHCSIGTDRTGYIAWLINAYLGVNEENLYRDYLFSNFGNIGGSRSVDSISSNYVKTINEAEGTSLSEKAKNYLLTRGVNESDLNVLKEMMI